MIKVIACLVPLAFSTLAYAQDIKARTTLKSGTILSAEDIIAGPGAPIDDVLGMSLKRSIYAGNSITMRDIRKPYLVRRNSKINLVFQHGNLKISTLGRALEHGSEGDLIEVMNLESRKQVSGMVVAPNLVKVRQ